MIKDPAGASKGIVVFTHKERALFDEGPDAARRALGRLRKRFVVAMHWGHYSAGVGPLSWVDVHLAAPGTLVFAPDVSARRIPLSSRNFIPDSFADRGMSRYWDLISVGRPLTLKNFDQMFEVLRRGLDRGHPLRALFICSAPFDMSVDDGWYADIYRDYQDVFGPRERELVTLLLLRGGGYPFPIAPAVLAHFYNQSRVFALFSDQEGESRAVAEALLCGAWVMAKAHVRGGAADYLTAENSRLFTTLDEATDALVELHERPDGPGNVAELRAELSESHSAPRLRRELEALFSELELPCYGTWHLDNLALELPGHVRSLPLTLRRELTNDLASPRAAIEYIHQLLDEPPPPGDLRDLDRELRRERVSVALSRARGAGLRTAAAARSSLRRRSTRTPVIIDRARRLGDFTRTDVSYPVALVKEEVARDHVFSLLGNGLTFLDVGARDGRLDYLLGIRQNLEIDAELYERNRSRFDAKFRYYGLDLEPAGDDRDDVLSGDICGESFLEEHPQHRESFDVVYSNNVFEHLRRPWVAARNVLGLLRPGGSCITIVPFSLRYHESPEDHFRFTHTGVVALFEAHGPVETVVSGYDITGRRNNWQGSGLHNDTCPVDEFGAWRENWFTVTIIRKPR